MGWWGEVGAGVISQGWVGGGVKGVRYLLVILDHVVSARPTLNKAICDVSATGIAFLLVCGS